MKIFTSLMLGGMVLCIMSIAACSKKKTSNETYDWKLIWSDEFDYTGLPDGSKWNYEVEGNAYGWGNQELQWYTAGKSENAHCDGDYLHIIAQKEEDNEDGFNYTSARLTTKGKGDWLYGRIEVRAKTASGRGIWPAIWMMPSQDKYGTWPRSGEIDIMEHVGYLPDSIFNTIHTQSFNHTKNTQVGTPHYIPDNESEFKVYAIEWDSQKIDYFIDEEKVFTFKNSGNGPDEWPFDQKFHLILNVAVGGSWGGIEGVDNDIFPSSMLVDYVRVYQ